MLPGIVIVYFCKKTGDIALSVIVYASLCPNLFQIREEFLATLDWYTPQPQVGRNVAYMPCASPGCQPFPLCCSTSGSNSRSNTLLWGHPQQPIHCSHALLHETISLKSRTLYMICSYHYTLINVCWLNFLHAHETMYTLMLIYWFGVCKWCLLLIHNYAPKYLE